MFDKVRQKIGKEGLKLLQKYINALQGISYSEWKQLEIIVNVNFHNAKEEMERNLHLSEIDPSQKDRSLARLGR